MTPKRLILFVLMIILVCSFGVSGYMLIEGWDFIDSLYMTLITLTTVGFQEVHILSRNGQIFTMVLLITGVGTVAYSLTEIIDFVITMNLNNRGGRKMDSKIKKLTNHVIVAGFGRMGKIVCSEFNRSNVKFVVIEKNKSNLNDLEKTDYLWVEGDATDDDILHKVGILSASSIVSMIDSDADALYLALAARTINPKINIVARASEESARKKILFAGANKVVLPFVVSGTKVAKSIINPNVEDFLEIAGADADHDERFELVDIHIDPSSELMNKTLRNCGIRRDGLIVVGIRKKTKQFVFAPNADYVFQDGDCLIALGSRDSAADALAKL